MVDIAEKKKKQWEYSFSLVEHNFFLFKLLAMVDIAKKVQRSWPNGEGIVSHRWDTNSKTTLATVSLTLNIDIIFDIWQKNAALNDVKGLEKGLMGLSLNPLLSSNHICCAVAEWRGIKHCS